MGRSLSSVDPDRAANVANATNAADAADAAQPEGAERDGARPMRADAKRNRALLIAAAHDAFTENGAEASLEDIARRAGVGVGTLYRHFPSRQALLEAVYVDEVEALCRSAADFADEPAWDALAHWFDRFVDYVATKKALVEEMMASMSRDAPVFRSCQDRDLRGRRAVAGPRPARGRRARRHRVRRRDPARQRRDDDETRQPRRHPSGPRHGPRRPALPAACGRAALSAARPLERGSSAYRSEGGSAMPGRRSGAATGSP